MIRSFGFGPAHVAAVLLLALSPQVRVWPMSRPPCLTCWQKIAHSQLLGNLHLPDVLLNEV